MSDYQATYSPEDNKLRLYAGGKLPRDLYERVKAAGFSWAGKQELFVAPMWTPEREDLLLELCGDIEDETMSREERAAMRSERFGTYSEKRGADAERAREAVSAIADHIPFGQPILVGHHSERRARKDAERIQNGMRKAVRLWETSKYWVSRAESVKRHAAYLERADVRARRIKTIEAEQRKQQRERDKANDLLKMWTRETLTSEQGTKLARYFCFPVTRSPFGYWSSYDVLQADSERHAQCPALSVVELVTVAKRHYSEIIARCDRWIGHCNNRLAYEKAMLEAQGATDLLKKPERPKQLPLCNYQAPEGICLGRTRYGEPENYGQVQMTAAEYAKIDSNYKGTRVVGNSHRVRVAIVRGKYACVFITDSKVHERPSDKEAAPREIPIPRLAESTHKAKEEDSAFDALKTQLKTGVQVIVAPQLFPTPIELARRMVAMLSDHGCAGLRVLEPSAGTGVLLNAVIDSATGSDCCSTVAVEMNPSLASELKRQRDRRLYANDSNHQVICADFLVCTPDMLGTFDAIVMNPPFADNQATHHVQHALSLLKPGGRLVAVMPAGIRFRDDRTTRNLRMRLESLHATFEDLPDGTFADAGTQVNTVLVSLTVPF